MYKRILVAIDGSETSRRALSEAIGLARDQQALLRIVHAAEGFDINEDAEFPEPSDFETEQERYLLGLLEKARAAANVAGVEAETQLFRVEKLGQGIADAIVEDAKTWAADLIVAGTLGRSGLSHLLMGSVAEGILRITQVPLLLVRADR